MTVSVTTKCWQLFGYVLDVDNENQCWYFRGVVVYGSVRSSIGGLCLILYELMFVNVQSRGDLGYICDLNSETKWSSESLKIITYDGVIFGSLSVKMFFVVSIWFCIDFVKIFIIFVCTKFDEPIMFLHTCTLNNSSCFTHS